MQFKCSIKRIYVFSHNQKVFSNNQLIIVLEVTRKLRRFNKQEYLDCFSVRDVCSHILWPMAMSQQLSNLIRFLDLM